MNAILFFERDEIRKIFHGMKKQKRYLIQPNQQSVVDENTQQIVQVVQTNADKTEDVLYCVGDVYAVESSHELLDTTLHLKIQWIKREDVREIDYLNAFWEGYAMSPKYGFLYDWLRVHDSSQLRELLSTEYDPLMPNHCPLWLRQRPEVLYTAWALGFEVVF